VGSRERAGVWVWAGWFGGGVVVVGGVGYRISGAVVMGGGGGGGVKRGGWKLLGLLRPERYKERSSNDHQKRPAILMVRTIEARTDGG